MTDHTVEARLAAARRLDDLEGIARPDLLASHARAWDWISGVGTWLTAERRCEIAEEVRRATECRLCRRRKEALTPYAITGEHDGLSRLPAVEIEAVHRLTTDSGRLTQAWVDGLIEDGLSDGEYIEIAGLVAMVMVMDAFARGVGVAPTVVPTPRERAGTMTRYRPPGAKKTESWVAILQPEDVVSADGPLYGPIAGGVHKALSLVPDSQRAYWALGQAHYIPMSEIRVMDTTVRAISRAQMEILAARVSALHQCVY